MPDQQTRQIRRQREAAWSITGAVIVAAIVIYLAVASALGR